MIAKSADDDNLRSGARLLPDGKLERDLFGTAFIFNKVVNKAVVDSRLRGEVKVAISVPRTH